MKKLLLTLALLVVSTSSYARPVSYPTGWTVMQNNDMDANSLHIHYSPTAKYSIGYKGEYWREKEWQFHGAQLNYLVKRWNEKASQANLYFKSGLGLARSDYQAFDDENEFAGFASINADWEDRRYFTSYGAHYHYAGDIDKFFTQKARIGIAPYIGDYGDIHTWFMLQADHNPTADDNFVLTPLVRMFKGEYLAEFGVSENKEVLANFIIRF